MSCPANSSGLITTNNNALVATGKAAKVTGVIMITDGTNAGTVTVYSGAAATAGNELVQLKGKAADTVNHISLPKGVMSNSGLFVTVSGTNAAYIILYNVI